jgi:glucose/arabinose dehydrogenase/cytochrome c2
MKKTLFVLIITTSILYSTYSNPTTPFAKGPIPADSATIAKGESLFNQYCGGCHNFRQDGMGPQLGGATTKLSVKWLQQFIKDPQRVIKSGDAHAQQLYKKYKVAMPSFASLKNDEVNAVIAFLDTHKQLGQIAVRGKGNALSDPIPAKITVSNMVVQLKELVQFPASSESGKMPLTRITKLDIQPNTGTPFVLDLRGKLYKLQNDKPEVYLDMAKLRSKFVNEPGLATGFGSFAFHPNFAKNGLIYTTHTEPPGTAKADFGYADSIKVTLQWVLTEWKADDPTATTFSGKGRELLRVNVVSGIHGVQEITFNPLAKPGDEDYGLLYVGIGDGGCVENGYPFLAHSRSSIWGTVIRIDPAGKNSTNGQYGIPSKNPFAKNRGMKELGEIYAYGFRNPHRITWTKAHQMLVSNVGHGNIESINLIEKGHDYGWPIREGNFTLDPYGDLNKVFKLPANDSSFHITYPVAEYDHDEGKAISGGYEYWGKEVPELNGKFLFGDIPTGRLFYIATADIKQGRQATIKECKAAFNDTVKSLRDVCGSDRVDLHFGRDEQGELYLMTKADGRLYKIVGAKTSVGK